MGKILDRLERLMFGATAEERVALMNRLIDQRVDQALGSLVAGLDADADHEEREQDQRQQSRAE